MAFKEDWSFLDKITMGAVGTEKVIRQMNANGHNIIELERYCTSNKIWATKIKRLRIPDLLCLRCGKRIESRAKSNLGIIMSDAENNPDRRWHSGLRKTDLVAFVECHKNAENLWEASDEINLFGVAEMLSTESQTQLSKPKSVFEGAERDRTWASYTPGNSISIASIEREGDAARIRYVNDKGRKQSRLVPAEQYLYVDAGQSYPAKSKIVSGIVPHTCDCGCSNKQYDFFADLSSLQRETKYAAVKALGFLPVSQKAIDSLQHIATDNETDDRIRLEAFASLIKLGVNAWADMYSFAFSLNSNEMRLEYVLILGELQIDTTNTYLLRVIHNPANDAELRAAAIWSLMPQPETLAEIIDECFSTESIVSNHAIAKIEKNFHSELTHSILSHFGDNEKKNAICAHILSNSPNVDNCGVIRQYLSAQETNIQNWILFSIGMSDKGDYAEIIDTLDPNPTTTKEKICLLWDCLSKYMDDTQQTKIEFIKKQR